MSRGKILLADDDRQFLTGLTLRLKQAGYDVVEARDGVSAVDLAAQVRPDLLILDIHMPAADGFNCIQRMSDDPALAPLPVIYITGDRDRENIGRAEHCGAMSVLRKPVDVQELLDTIQLLIGDLSPALPNDN